MPTVDEAIGAKNSQLANELAAGVNLLSGNQKVTFNLYKKMILPLDGFVFWVNYSLLAPSEGDPPAQTTISGSLHYSTEVEQAVSSTISINTIVFTALSRCDLFNQINPQFMYLATYNGFRFSFSSQGKYYQQADLWHYLGIAVKSTMETQIIDTQDQLDALANNQIISNSLPIWLAMPAYVPPYPGFTCPIANLYPSFLIPENVAPPYASIHIEETRALVEAAYLDLTLSSSQLSSEIVKVTTYGVNNADVITFLNFVLQYSYDWNYIGIMNMPIISDEKEAQAEIQTIAQKKLIEFKISYLQGTVRDVARQYINKVKITPTPIYPGSDLDIPWWINLPLIPPTASGAFWLNGGVVMITPGTSLLSWVNELPTLEPPVDAKGIPWRMVSGGNQSDLLMVNFPGTSPGSPWWTANIPETEPSIRNEIWLNGNQAMVTY
jgi:hypothetical protein